MNKKIIALVLTGIMLVPTAVFAEGNKGTNKGKAEIETKIQNSTSTAETNEQEDKAKENKSQENKAASQEFKAQIRAKHEIMKANTKKINELKKQVNTKREELSSILEAIKAGTKTLSADQLNILTTKAAALKQVVQEVKSLPALKADVENTQEDIKVSKFEAALASLDKVIAKQEARYAKLQELSSKLDELLVIARQAQPVVSTSTPSDPATSAVTAQ